MRSAENEAIGNMEEAVGVDNDIILLLSQTSKVGCCAAGVVMQTPLNSSSSFTR